MNVIIMIMKFGRYMLFLFLIDLVFLVFLNNKSSYAEIAVDENSNGSTIQVALGQVIELTLHSTYWKVEGSSDQYVVSQNTEPSRMPAPSGTCPPGVGCGMVHVAFTARQQGTARISASRTLCGEALLCKPDQQSFLLTVVVH